MPVYARPRDWGLKQPSPGASVNFGHPLARGLTGCWLLNQGAGPTASLLNPYDRLALRTNAAWANGPDLGIGVWDKATATTTSGLALAAPSAMLKPPKLVTLVWRGMFLGAPGGANGENPRIASMENNNADSSPFVSYGMWRNATGPDTIEWVWNNGSFQRSNATNLTLSTRYRQPMQLALTVNGEDSKVRGYDGAKLVYSGSTAGTISYGATAELLVGGSASHSAACNAIASLVYAWNRPLQPQEIGWLNAEPYAFIDPRRPLRYAAIPDASTFLPQIRVF